MIVCDNAAYMCNTNVIFTATEFAKSLSDIAQGKDLLCEHNQTQ